MSRNPNGAFTRTLRHASESLSRDAAIAVAVLAHEMYDTQDPVVICDDVFADLLDAPEARSLFERVGADWAV